MAVIAGYRYTWWREDELPPLPPIPHFRVEPQPDPPLLAHLHQLYLSAIQDRLLAGHRPYLAFLGDSPVACGWVATQTERIGPGLEWPLAASEYSLWDFVTLPAWRGQGFYPHLLQTTLQFEMAQAERFWIGHTPENSASRRGILKAGFQPTLLGVSTALGQTKWILQGDRQRALADPMARYLNLRSEDLSEQ